MGYSEKDDSWVPQREIFDEKLIHSLHERNESISRATPSVSRPARARRCCAPPAAVHHLLAPLAIARIKRRGASKTVYP